MREMGIYIYIYPETYIKFCAASAMGREYGGDRRGYSAPASAPRNSGMYMPSEEMGDYEQMREKR